MMTIVVPGACSSRSRWMTSAPASMTGRSRSGHGAAEAFGLRQGRTVAAKRSSFSVRVSFHTRWKAPALAVMPW